MIRGGAILLAGLTVAMAPEAATAQAPAVQAEFGIAVAIEVAPPPVAFASRRRIAGHHAYRQRAQSQSQGAIPVRIDVTANAKAGMFFGMPQGVVLTAAAGTTANAPCAFTVEAHTKLARWTILTALSNDFAEGRFPGSALQWSLVPRPARPTPVAFRKPYQVATAGNVAIGPAAPLAAPRSYVVASVAGVQPQLAATGSADGAYCVNLSVAVPAAIPAGMYATTAIYQLFG